MPKRVLIVDDEEDAVEFLKAVFELFPREFLVKTAKNAEDAIAIGLAFKPDVLVTDWLLRDKQDGVDVARVLTFENRALRTVFFTALRRDLLKKLRETGAEYEAVIEKPIEDFSEIVDAARQARG